jgi:hypothetical protein
MFLARGHGCQRLLRASLQPLFVNATYLLWLVAALSREWLW